MSRGYDEGFCRKMFSVPGNKPSVLVFARLHNNFKKDNVFRIRKGDVQRLGVYVKTFLSKCLNNVFNQIRRQMKLRSRENFPVFLFNGVV